MRQKALRAVKEPGIPQHGSFIYAYCHVQTKQVLYSLERTLHPSALKQLPDIGANHTPPTLRKDIWRPLFSVQLPNTPAGRRQGLDAFRKLREYRILHETNWEPPKELSLPYNEKRKKEIKDKLDKRGGSKTENVLDVIRREKKKLRKRIIMNQKANSVADLAAVLLAQEDMGKMQTTENRNRRQEETEQLLGMAEQVKKDGIRGVQKEIRELWRNINRRRILRRDQKTLAHIKTLELKIKMMKFAEAAVAWARLPEGQKKQEVQYWLDQASADISPETNTQLTREGGKERRYAEFANKLLEKGYNGEQIAITARIAGLKAEPVQEAATENNTADPEKEHIAVELLPSLPSEFDSLKPSVDKLSRSSGRRREIKRVNRPVFSSEGITVRWADIFDLEYAKEWPAEVQHERMGLVRHEHPKIISNEPIDDISVFKALQWKYRKESWEMESDTLSKVQAIRAAKGLVQEPSRPSRLIEESKLSPHVRLQLHNFRQQRASQIEAAEPQAETTEDSGSEGAAQQQEEKVTPQPEGQEQQPEIVEEERFEKTAEEVAERERGVIEAAARFRQKRLHTLAREYLLGTRREIDLPPQNKRAKKAQQVNVALGRSATTREPRATV